MALWTQYQKPAITVLTVLLILLPIFLAFLFRSYTAEMGATENWARSSVENSVRNSISAQVAQQYPNLPSQNRQQLVDEQFAIALEENKEQIDQQVAQTAAFFKAGLQDEQGQTYLLAIDPYQFIRQVENNIENGHVGDVLVDGEPYDMHMYAPIGTPSKTRFHVEATTLLYKFVSIFTDTRPISVIFWIPVIFSLLAVIPAFFIGKWKAGLLGGFFTAMLVAVHSGFIGRTAAGFSDTDAYVILFPLLCGWFLLEAFECTWGDWKRWGIFIGLTGICFGLFATAWEWWYFFDIFLLVMLAYLAFIVLKQLVNKEELRTFFTSDRMKAWALTFGGFVVSTGIFVSLFKGVSTFFSAPLNAVRTTGAIKSAVNVGNLWPNVQTTVAELNAPSISGIINSIGGKFLFVVALLGILATLLPRSGRLLLKDWLMLGIGLFVSLYLVGPGASLSIFQFLVIMAVPVAVGFVLLLKDEREVDVKYALFLFLWLAASVFTMTKGVRFVLLLIPPFAIAAGIAIGAAYRLLRDWLTKNVKFSVLWVAPVLFILFSLLLIPPVAKGHAIGLQEAPSMSDAWWNSLTKIKQESAPDAIINSWWDFGHWFKYVADRAVTFDGGSQNVPHAHWIGRVLITPDEKEALAILRMVDCGNYLGVEDVRAGLPTDDYYTAIALTKEIIMLPPGDARARLLEEGVSEAQTEVVLNHTHCEPPENYFITSADMIGKGGVWGHFGSWNFKRADAYQNMRLLDQAEASLKMQEKYGWDEELANSIYYDMQTLSDQREVNTWISSWPGYPMSNWRGCTYQENGTLVVCTGINVNLGEQQGSQGVLEGLVINLTDMNSSRLVLGFYQNGRRVGENLETKPRMLLLTEDDDLVTHDLGSSSFNQAFLIDTRGTPRVLMLDPANAAGMFTRLFFLEGYSTTAFELFSDQNAFNMGRILVWKVDWTQLEAHGLV